jgi:hypothetical protein
MLAIRVGPGECVKAKAVDEDGLHVALLGRVQSTEKEDTTMADELRIGLAELLCKARIEHDADFLMEGVRVLSQRLMEVESQEFHHGH